MPVYVSAQADITLEPSIKVAGKISWTKNVKVEAQAGARHQGDGNIKLKGYANVRGNESKGHDVPQCRVLRRTEPDTGNRHRGRPQAEAV